MTNFDFISRVDVAEWFKKPLHELLRIASETHKNNFPEGKIFINTLVSYKTGG